MNCKEIKYFLLDVDSAIGVYDEILKHLKLR